MSYFDFLSNNVIKTGNRESITGTCYEMCPKIEETLRLKEGLIHILEVNGSTRQLVKCYSRSAADSHIAVPSLLRPFSVLLRTLQHLLLRVSQRKDVSAPCMYNFINDRLRAIRQDTTVQRIPPDQCMQLLEPMIRFYVYFGYRLSSSPLNDFDPVLNKKYLLECMKWFLHCSDEVNKQTDAKVYNLSSLMSNWGIDKNSTANLSCDKILVECLYMMCNIDDLHPLYRYLSLRPEIKCTPALKLAYQITIANLHGNYIKTCRLADKLCPLTYCAFILYLPRIQRDALRVMSVAYNSRVGGIPTSVLHSWLGYNNEELTKTACIHYGLKTDKDLVKFLKGDFKMDIELFRPQNNMQQRVNQPFEEILTYCVQ